MTHRVHPYIFRINQLTTWRSRWFSGKKFAAYLREDTLLREWLMKKLRANHIDAIEMERGPNVLSIIIKTSRPGLLIGRGGEGIQQLKRAIDQELARLARRVRRPLEKQEVKVSVEEVRSPESHAAIAAQMLVEDLEKRMSFRRALKTALEKSAGAKDVKGVKIAMKGRLDGAEMARYEWAKKGRIPLATLRANIDYAEKTAYTAYGTIGVKVWIYKGDVFEKERS
ncbi:MAG: 30S ribosomal protein S3 [Candidatus Sungbacteria bacterium]|uniref:Small ribosomal subunit protein uS3 n=1 Tax=Candidatus Sungiibacteriota bacterium TaxID=2750080 RepID=A0A932R090_9BACT|nr:30S ribosomal protein S3 [Candidatus Sungbacteria bacterium]